MAHEALASPSDRHDNSQLVEAIRMLNIRNSQVEDSASEDTASTSRKNTVSKSRRLSESGIPSGLKQNRISSSGNVSKTPNVLASPRGGSAMSTPRETRSSILRKSMGSSDGSSLRAALAAMKDGSSTPNAAGSELVRLRTDLRTKQKEVEELETKLSALQTSLSSKERTIAKAQSGNEALKTRVGKLEGDLLNKTKSCRTLESANLQLQSRTEDLNKEVDRLRQRLEAAPKGTGLSEAIATLEGEIRQVKADNAKLEHDNKGAYNQIRAKDKELDTMALEVEAAHEVLIQNGELENYVMQLRQQMDEGASERGTLIGVQRQLRNDLAKLADEASEAHTEAANARHELNVCQTQLRASEEHSREIAHELELRRKELVRVGKVASRAAHKDASSIKEAGMVEFHLHKEEVMQLRAEHEKTKEKLKAAEMKLTALQNPSGQAQALKPSKMEGGGRLRSENVAAN